MNIRWNAWKVKNLDLITRKLQLCPIGKQLGDGLVMNKFIMNKWLANLLRRLKESFDLKHLKSFFLKV